MPKLLLRKQTRQVQYFPEELGNDIHLDMIQVPNGEFEMGSLEQELQRQDSEGPQRTVTVSSFFLGRYPVTQAQWRVVASLPSKNRMLDPDPSKFKGDNRPVETVNWYDAVEFCDRLHQKTGRPYRLPTEAEWEYACRAGTKTPFYFGPTISAELANYHGITTYAYGPKGTYREETTPVDHFDIANAFGLCDMHGNVLEWCQDHWHDNFEGAPKDGSAWLTEDDGASRIIRGGSWSDYPNNCRSACRLNNAPVYAGHDLGFRVACSAPRTQ